MQSATDDAGPNRHNPPTDASPSDVGPLWPLMLIAAAGYGLFGAIAAGLFLIPGLLDRTLPGDSGIGKMLFLLGLAALICAAIGAMAAAATHRNETKVRNARRNTAPSGQPNNHTPA